MSLTYETFITEALLVEALLVKKNVIRGGQAIRRKPVSSRKGYSVRGGSVYRMTPEFRRRLSVIQKRAAKKRKLKMNQTLKKRKRSMAKRKLLGFDK